MSVVVGEVVARLRGAGCVFAEDEAALLIEAADDDAGRLDALVAARIAGAPLEQVLGWAELRGHRWTVAPGVFVPRRRSELLVREAVTRLLARATSDRSAPTGDAAPTGASANDPGSDPGHRAAPHGSSEPGHAPGSSGVRAPARTGAPPGAVVVDLCCGCGALGGSVVLDLHAAGYDAALHAADADPAATACARDNLAGVPHTRVYDGDLDAPLPGALRGEVDVLLCNAPYVPTDAIALMPREARDHEPRLALDGGPDGLAVLRRAITAAPSWLRPGGTLLFETGHDQADAAAAAVTAAGLTPTVISDADLGATAIAALNAPT